MYKNKILYEYVYVHYLQCMLHCHAEAESQHRMLCQQLIKDIQQRKLCNFLHHTKRGIDYLHK